MVKAYLQYETTICIHDDLQNAAWHLTERVKKRAAADDRQGLAHDCMAALTLVAFTFEANLNFIGKTVVDGWNERTPVHEKLKAVAQ